MECYQHQDFSSIVRTIKYLPGAEKKTENEIQSVRWAMLEFTIKFVKDVVRVFPNLFD